MRHPPAFKRGFPTGGKSFSLLRNRTLLTVCDFLPVRTVTVRPATSVLKLDGVMLMNEVLHLQCRGAAQRQPYAAWLLHGELADAAV